MRIGIEIPKEYENDYNNDKFQDFFSRVLCDIKDGTLCGTYEKETAEMFGNAFKNAKVYNAKQIKSNTINSIIQGLYGISESEKMIPQESARFTLNKTVECLEIALGQYIDKAQSLEKERDMLEYENHLAYVEGRANASAECFNKAVDKMVEGIKEILECNSIHNIDPVVTLAESDYKTTSLL